MPEANFATPFPVIDTDPHFSRVVRYFRPSDYAAWGAGTAAFPFGLWALERINPTLKHAAQIRPVLKVGALMGAIGGFLYAYQSSSQRFWGWSENRRELEMYAREWRQLRAEGKPLHGESRLTPDIQSMAAGNSRYSALKFGTLFG